MVMFNALTGMACVLSCGRDGRCF